MEERAAQCQNFLCHLLLPHKTGNSQPFHRVCSAKDAKGQKGQIIPVEVVIRNVMAGSISKRLGIPEGTALSEPLIEFYLKNDDLHDPIICENHVTGLGFATRQQLDVIKGLAFKVNDAMKKFFLDVGLRLIDFKLEFGTHKGQVILADEFSPDTCRLWDVNTNEKMDKDRFRRDMGGVMEAYLEVARRIHVQD